MTAFGDEIVRTFFKFQNELKLYHWQTYSYARHKAADSLFSDLGDSTDEFIEIFMGKYGKRVKLSPKRMVIRTFTDSNVDALLLEFRNFLTDLEAHLPSKRNTSDLLNIRDELLGKVNQTLYLFTLH